MLCLEPWSGTCGDIEINTWSFYGGVFYRSAVNPNNFIIDE